MAAPRLPFLWPSFIRSVEACNASTRSARAAARIQAFHTPASRQQHEPITKRYGSANEPPPHLGGAKGLDPASNALVEQPALPRIGDELQKDGEHEAQVEAEERKRESATVDGQIAATPIGGTFKLDLSEGVPEAPPPRLESPEEKPLETLLDAVPTPVSKERQDKEQDSVKTAETASSEPVPDEHAPPIYKAPHIDTPRHVHHFDTYGLVKRLVEGGWSDTQSITVMKSMRLMLADNMDLAKDALISKSNVENETYLFRAACAELRTEITSRRRVEQEKMRTERTQLQHEVEILGQRMSQDSGVMKEEVRGMFDDRKMAVRNEQRNMESKVHQLNYKITVELQADARSEVEGLRWVTTRRVIIALATVVIMVVGSLKLASNSAKDEDSQPRRKAKPHHKDASTQTEDVDDESSRNGPGSAGTILVSQGENPGYVSLG